MFGIRFVLLNIFVTIIVSLIVFATGLWWLQNFSGVPTVSPSITQESVAGTGSVEALLSAPADTTPAVVAAALPAVVSIVITAEVPLYERYTEEVNPFGSWWGGFSIPRQRQVGTEEREIGGGTGFFVSPEGYLITNRHVVDQAGVDYTVVTNDGTAYPVTVIARDPVLDIAVLQVQAEGVTFDYLNFATSTEPRLGASVIAIGNALAEFPNSVSVGVVSGLSRNITARSGFGFETLDGLIQTDAAINQGNSGGPLLNMQGEVIGVNVAVAGGSENIGFALPANVVSSVLTSVLETGTIERAFLGVRYVPVTDSLVARNNLPVDYGVLVIRGEEREDLAVLPGSPAAEAGIVENDIILAIDGVALREGRQLATILRQYGPGDRINVTVWRNGTEREVSLTLASVPD